MHQTRQQSKEDKTKEWTGLAFSRHDERRQYTRKRGKLSLERSDMMMLNAERGLASCFVEAAQRRASDKFYGRTGQRRKTKGM